MEELLTELHVDLHLRLLSLLKNARLTAIVNFVVLICFQLCHIYLVIAIIERILNIEVTHYLRGHLLVNLPLVIIVLIVNLLAQKNAQQILKKNHNDLFISRRFTFFFLFTFILLLIHWLELKLMVN
jgi:hypothetical protein